MVIKLHNLYLYSPSDDVKLGLVTQYVIEKLFLTTDMALRIVMSYECLLILLSQNNSAKLISFLLFISNNLNTTVYTFLISNNIFFLMYVNCRSLVHIPTSKSVLKSS